ERNGSDDASIREQAEQAGSGVAATKAPGVIALNPVQCVAECLDRTVASLRSGRGCCAGDSAGVDTEVETTLVRKLRKAGLREEHNCSTHQTETRLVTDRAANLRDQRNGV